MGMKHWKGASSNSMQLVSASLMFDLAHLEGENRTFEGLDLNIEKLKSCP